MKVAILDKNNLYKFENELASALQKFKLKGYALMGFGLSLGSKTCNIDALIILESGVFICLEAKGYAGKWTGSVNDKWFCDGKEINSRGINPFTQVLDYAFAVKDKLQKTTFKDSQVWVNCYIVAPDCADFSDIEGAIINQYQIGKSINVCNISQLEGVLSDIRGNQDNTEIIKSSGIEKVICELVDISTLRLQELTVSTNVSSMLNFRGRKGQALKTKPILRNKFPHPSQNIVQNKMSTKKFPVLFGTTLTVLVGLTFIIIFGFKYWQFSLKSRIAVNSLEIGILTEGEKYKSLQTYLEEELIVDDFWRFFKGDRIKITIDGDKTLQYEEAKSRIANKNWDIVFTLSPMNSVAARDNNYHYLARMFPQNPPFYQSALVVKSDSNISYIDDLNPRTVIAMGAVSSASSFFMPSYDLYGKTLVVKKNNRGQKIIEMVKSEEVDLGAVAYNEDLIKDTEIRVIQISRNIPGSGVYLSPKLSEQDRNTISKVMLNASKDVQKDSNYGEGQEPDYTAFLKIVRRVEEVLSCSDFNQNPVMLFCPVSKTSDTLLSKPNIGLKIMGKINGFRVPSVDTVWLNIESEDRLIYKVIISKVLLNQIPKAGSPLNLQNKKVEISNSKLRKLNDGTLEILIDNVNQFRVLP